MSDRSQDWFRQAEKNRQQAEDSLRTEQHERACLTAHQAAEMSVKALHLHCGREAWGRRVARLLAELPEEVGVPSSLVEKGRVLDNFYVLTWYPSGHPEGAPIEHYGPMQSEEAVRYAGEILAFVRSEMARH